MATAVVDQPSLLDISILKKIAYDNLIVQLEYMHGQKDLVLDEELMKPLDRFAGVSVLKKHDVDKIFKLEDGAIETGCNRRIYITRPYISRMKIIAGHIRKDKERNVFGEYRVVLTPKRLAICEAFLEEEGLYGDVVLDEFPLDFIALDDDVLSLEMNTFFRDYFVNRNFTWNSIVARAINTIQLNLGTISNVTCIGNCSQMIYDLLKIFMEDENEYIPTGGPEISSAIFLDRDVDYTTPLCSQLSYEGLIADVFGISSGYVELPSDVKGSGKKVRVLLDSNDQVFQEVRGMHFTGVFPLLSSKAKEIQFGYNKKNDLQSVSQLKNFVSQDLKGLKQQHKSLTMHIAACESILKQKTADQIELCLQTERDLLEDINNKDTFNYVEECIHRQVLLLNSLRLVCLFGLTRSSLDMNRLKSLKHQYLQSYGYNHLLTFHNLEKVGLFPENQERKGQFQKIRRKMNLVPKDPSKVDLKDPKDMSYIFGGAYSPLSIKLIEQLLTKGYNSIEDIARILNVPISNNRKAVSVRVSRSHTQPSDAALRTILIVFLGGCTHSEITALRFLGKQRGYRFLILTTAVINGATLLKTLLP